VVILDDITSDIQRYAFESQRLVAYPLEQKLATCTAELVLEREMNVELRKTIAALQHHIGDLKTAALTPKENHE
jgi:uncharacterized protein YqgQ